MDINDCSTCIFVGQREVKLSIKTSRTTESRINGIRSIGCTNYNNLTPTIHTVHKRKQCCDNGGMNLLLLTRSYRGETLNKSVQVQSDCILMTYHRIHRKR